MPPYVCFIIFIFISATASDSMGKNTTTIEFIMEHARWRDWRSIVFITSSTKEFAASDIDLLRATSQQSIFAAISQTKQTRQFSSHYAVVSFFGGANSTLYLPSSLIICNGVHKSSLLKELGSVNSSLEVSSDVVIAYFNDDEQYDKTVFLELAYKSQNLTTIPMGNWTFGTEPKFQAPHPEARKLDGNVTLRVGVKNITENSDLLTSIVEKAEEVQMLFLVDNLLSALNVSHELLTYQKLGSFSEDGGWTNLLGAVAEGVVDIAADVVDTNIPNIREAIMLSDPIVRSMRNIYLKRPYGGKVRDVLLATFHPVLQLCVFLTFLLLWILMFALTTARAKKIPSSGKADRLWEPTEALLWAISVLCMQGSPWTPRSLSGCILLIFSLMFALITYNSFGAFITSILSVQSSSINNVQDLLQSEFSFGYTQNSAEETFLRAADDATLRKLYYKGLVSGGGVEDISTGMARTYLENFAFFVNVRFARHSLRILVPSQWRCRIMELNVPMTVTNGAIPISKLSPFSPLIQFWLLRMRETGLVPYIRSRLVIPMPTCTNRQLFHGAGITDIFSAYVILTIGFISSFIILLFEIAWAKRKLFLTCCKHHNIFHHHAPNRRQYQNQQYIEKLPYGKNLRWGGAEFFN